MSIDSWRELCLVSYANDKDSFILYVVAECVLWNSYTSHNFMFVLTWLYGVIVSDGCVESHCETIEIAIAGILNKLYAWRQVVYLNRSHSLLLNRLVCLSFVLHLFLRWYGSNQLSYLWRSTSRQSVVQLMYDANHQHFSNFKSKTWKVKGLALTFTESFGPRQSIIAYQPIGFDILHLAIIMWCDLHIW